jgi:acyl-CoA synthetase (AMP-forming)/AMP-acid ligase II
MPLFHIHGLVAALLASLEAGAGVICTPGFIAPSVLDWMRDLRPTWYTAVPRCMRRSSHALAQRESEKSEHNLRFIRSSSSALPQPVLAQLEEIFGVPVIEAYGMTEAAHQMASNPLPPRARKPGTVGLAAGPAIAILDQRDDTLRPARAARLRSRVRTLRPDTHGILQRTRLRLQMLASHRR